MSNIADLPGAKEEIVPPLNETIEQKTEQKTENKTEEKFVVPESDQQNKTHIEDYIVLFVLFLLAGSLDSFIYNSFGNSINPMYVTLGKGVILLTVYFLYKQS